MKIREWEEIFVELLRRENIEAYPLVSPLEANHEDGHVVYSLNDDEVYSAYDGIYTDGVNVTIDARAEKYVVARDLLNKCVDALGLVGRHKTRFIEDREPITATQDNATGLYRFLINATLNPNYIFLEDNGRRAFSNSFSRAFG